MQCKFWDQEQFDDDEIPELFCCSGKILGKSSCSIGRCPATWHAECLPAGFPRPQDGDWRCPSCEKLATPTLPPCEPGA